MIRRHFLASGRPANGRPVFADEHGRRLARHGRVRFGLQRIATAAGRSGGAIASREAVAQAQARGLPKPPPYGVQVEPEAHGHQANREPEPTGRFVYTRADVIAAVQEFVATLAADEPPMNKRWRGFQRGRAGIPSLNVIIDQAG